MFQYDPKYAQSVIPEGVYQAVIKSASEGISKKGNPMLTIVFSVCHGERAVEISDYITQTSFGTEKYGAIAAAIGESRAFDMGIFDVSQHVGRQLTVEVGVRPGGTNDSGKPYRESNQINGYSEASFDPAAVAAVEAASQEEAEIPF